MFSPLMRILNSLELISGGMVVPDLSAQNTYNLLTPRIARIIDIFIVLILLRIKMIVLYSNQFFIEKNKKTPHWAFFYYSAFYFRSKSYADFLACSSVLTSI